MKPFYIARRAFASLVARFRAPKPDRRHPALTHVCSMAALAGLTLAMALSANAAGPGLRNSKHNLALADASKPLVAGETEMCNFCHTPHGGTAEKALWNQALSRANYTPYSSTTMKATVGQPTGDSKLCLSCHDGTVAPGTLHRQNPNASGRIATARMAPGPAVLGTDLSDDHPVSFSYDTSLANGSELKHPAMLNERVRLDERGQVQCTSCHDPHNDQNGKFLVQNNYASGLCLSCHNPKLWTASSHRNSARTRNGTGKNPWPHTSFNTVLANGCENCHAPHNAGTHQRLLNFTPPEDNCLVCHNGSVAAKNVAIDFNKPSAHPVLTTSSLHDQAEDPLLSRNRHASCVDCHNPHAANASPAVAPNASGAIAGTAGANASGVLVRSVAREYELCFRCHAETVVKSGATILRQQPEPNIRLQFVPGNASYHPVVGVGKNSRVPSLVLPWNTSSLMYCTDCHNNEQAPAAGGSGANGPHGSLYRPILERQLIVADFNNESAGAYALCYKCHDRNSILSDQSFPAHKSHIVDHQTACTTCHASHGVHSQPHLINFNNVYVSRSSNGRLEYVSLGTFKGNCSLSCHGKDHNARSYGY